MLMRIKNFLALSIGTFFGVGLIPKAPGTFGSLAALPFAWLLWKLPSPISWLIVSLTFLFGTWAAHIIIQRTKIHDHQSIVIDEVVGIFLVTAVGPEFWPISFPLAFIFFRLFDIWKPWPVGWVDKKWKGPWGAMLDDAVAATLAAIILAIFLYFGNAYFPGLFSPDCHYNERAKGLCSVF